MISLRMLNQVLAIMSHFHSLNCTVETIVQKSKGRQVEKKKKPEFSDVLNPFCMNGPAFIIKPQKLHLTSLEKEHFWYPLAVFSRASILLKITFECATGNDLHKKDLFKWLKSSPVYFQNYFSFQSSSCFRRCLRVTHKTSS